MHYMSNEKYLKKKDVGMTMPNPYKVGMNAKLYRNPYISNQSLSHKCH